jgi:hypothetical protein
MGIIYNGTSLIKTFIGLVLSYASKRIIQNVPIINLEFKLNTSKIIHYYPIINYGIIMNII